MGWNDIPEEAKKYARIGGIALLVVFILGYMLGFIIGRWWG